MQNVLSVPFVEDFEPKTDAPQWELAARQPLRTVSGPLKYRTEVQCLYSSTGIYVRFFCEDRRLSCTILEDMESLYREDVTEIFLWPSEKLPIYFEYEQSPLNRELCLMVCNTGDFYGWTPFEYEGGRRTKHFATVEGGEAGPWTPCRGWTCSTYLPFALLEGVCKPPARGDTWRANFYRIDYDGPEPTHFAWDPDTGKEFHEFRQFGTIRFD